ncbi:DUF1775 domain-containing protein [Lentzea sp. NPDC102401]|uniref:DUF1775 domain-containing protein n=1 Tax=Lentzea sp. NPDC102401 TaxID=3364128 RepID=UPI00380DCE5C
MLIRLLACVAALFALGAGTAAAHVTVQVPDSIPEKGGYGTVVVRVPNEETSATAKLELTLSPSYGITTARTRPVQGWDASVLRGPGGVVTSVVWTARPGSEIRGGDEYYEDFGLTLGPLPADADRIALPATQFLSDGGTVGWDDQPDRPAPALELAEPSTHDHHGGVALPPDVPWVAVMSGVGVGLALAIAGFFILRRKEIS